MGWAREDRREHPKHGSHHDDEYGSDTQRLVLVGAAHRSAISTGDEIVVVIDPDQHLQTAAAIAQLQVLTAGADKAFDTVAIHADVPTDLQAGTTVILLGNEAWVAPAIHAQYPQATQTVQRAINANPLLYIYELR